MGGFTRVSWAGRARRRASDLSPPSHAVACTLSAAHRIRVAQRCSASSHRASATPPTRTVRSDSTPSARGVLGSEPPARLWRPLAAAAGRAAAPAVGGCGQGLQQVVGRARTAPPPFLARQQGRPGHRPGPCPAGGRRTCRRGLAAGGASQHGRRRRHLWQVVEEGGVVGLMAEEVLVGGHLHAGPAACGQRGGAGGHQGAA